MNWRERSGWLQGLQVGDEVSNGESILTVERVTATQITAGGKRYLRSTGRLHGGSNFSRGGRLEPADRDERERVAKRQHIEQARAKLRRIELRTRRLKIAFAPPGLWDWNDEQTIAIDAAAATLLAALGPDEEVRDAD